MMDPAKAAKTAFLCYRQLEELLARAQSVEADKMSQAWTGHAITPSYNEILKRAKECFAIDAEFSGAVAHLSAITAEAWEAHHELMCDGPVLRGTLRAFIELYLAPEERKKAIGFEPPA